MKTKVYLVGPLLTRSGYGEQTRFALRALRSREDLYDIYIQPLNWGATSWVPFHDEEKDWIDDTIEKTISYLQQGGTFDVSIQVTIPNEFKRICPVNIGYTAGIETTKVSANWIQQANEMDSIVVVSNHSKNVFENTVYTGTDPNTNQQVELRTSVPISAVGYPVKHYDKLPELEFPFTSEINFLTVAQWGPRKNLPNTISWFIEEFMHEDVGLVIKTNHAKNSLIDREHCEGQLRQLVGPYGDIKCRIYLLHGDMTDEEMHALYSHEKISALVGIPHGEGFGLPFFEAAYMGLPVVCTGWSGQMDFLVDQKGNDRFYNVAYDINQIPEELVWDDVLIKESGWSYARPVAYRNQLRTCYEEIKANTGHAASACEYATELAERFDASTMYEKFIDSLNLKIDHEWANELSQVEIL